MTVTDLIAARSSESAHACSYPAIDLPDLRCDVQAEVWVEFYEFVTRQKNGARESVFQFQKVCPRHARNLLADLEADEAEYNVFSVKYGLIADPSPVTESDLD